MTDKHTYYLGIIICFIVGAIITPFYGVFITVVRLATCIWGIVCDTFFFVPTMASAFHYKFWVEKAKLEQNKNNLN